VLREKILSADLGVDARIPQQKASSRQISDALADFFDKHRPSMSQQHIDFEPAAATAERRSILQKSYPEQKEYGQYFKSKNHIQIHDTFIITETDEGFMIIDQHALHERIMYENLRSRLQTGNLESQKLLIPESFEVTAGQAAAIQNNSQIFEKLGIELEPFGPRQFAIQSFPVLLAKARPTELVKDLLDLLADKENADEQSAEGGFEDVLNMAACKAAIKAGQRLNDNEIEQLLSDREKLEQAGRCPHGRPTMIKFSKAELEKQFKRT
jgi:DNA mismatch repair protein MutL